MQLARLGVVTLVFSAILSIDGFVTTQSADAGPLMDWLMRRRQAYYAPYYPAQYGYTNSAYYPQQPACGSCQTTCQQTCQRVVAQYVPYTAYRTVYQQVPVTVYRQTTTRDPMTGCTITCNRPCTTFQQTARRVPYTAYRTVYRTETFRMPVTTYTTPAPACSTCSTESFPNTYSVPNTYSNVSPSTNVVPGQNGLLGSGMQLGTVAPQGSTFNQGFGGGVPADSAPMLGPGDVDGAASGFENESLKPIPEVNSVLESSGSTDEIPLNGASGKKTSVRQIQPYNRHRQAPRLINPNDRTASAPVRRRWNYHPVHLASYEVSDRHTSRTSSSRISPSRYETKSEIRRRPRNVNVGWTSGP